MIILEGLGIQQAKVEALHKAWNNNMESNYSSYEEEPLAKIWTITSFLTLFV
uniref:Uncharacterized protein n=1 Tax=Physcomitrium patens TaxID=3218 RepID=A0A2K1IC42_PHYPA|nr:hypothetical protein PHYPA_030341 [Physcomitrium patens]